MDWSTFDWYKMINQTEFLALGLPSRELSLVLEGKGLKSVMILSGQFVSVVYDGVMLSPGMNDENPFAFDGYAAYLDAADDLWLGIPNT
jgi:hypothetical protein